MKIQFKKILPLALLFFIAGISSVNAQTKMIVTSTPDGSATEFNLKDVKSLTFAPGNMMVNQWANESNTFMLKNVESIKFQGDPSSVNEVAQDTEALHIVCEGNLLNVLGWTQGQAANVAVYNLSGQTLISLPCWNGDPIDMVVAPRGIYIIKINNKSYKFIIK